MKNEKFITPKIRSRRAFTLIELLVVIVIIAILAAATSKIMDYASSSQARAKVSTDLAAIGTGLEAFKSMYNDYPRLNSKSNGANAENALFRCMAGLSFMKLEGDYISFVDIQSDKDLKSFVDISTVKWGDPDSPDKESVSFDSKNVSFIDPWGNPYKYYYNPSLMVGAVNSWEGTSFILLSKGRDGKDVEVRSMYSTGIMPDARYYREPSENVDNIVYGYEE